MLYKNVYFRIDRNGYEGHRGWTDDTSSKRFNDEILKLFQSEGWEWVNEKEQKSYGCPEIQKGLQDLYLHPQNVSGIVIAEEIPDIERLLSRANSFRHCHTDIYEDYVVLTDESYMRCLENQREEITKDILERFKTKRRNLYYTGFDLLGSISKKYRVKRVGMKNQYSDLEAPFISDIFMGLLESGLIVSAKTKHGDGYRAAKKDEITKIEISA